MPFQNWTTLYNFSYTNSSVSMSWIIVLPTVAKMFFSSCNAISTPSIFNNLNSPFAISCAKATTTLFCFYNYTFYLTFTYRPSCFFLSFDSFLLSVTCSLRKLKLIASCFDSVFKWLEINLLLLYILVKTFLRDLIYDVMRDWRLFIVSY